MAGKGPWYDEGLHCAEILGQTLSENDKGTPQFALSVRILGVPTDAGTFDAHEKQMQRTVWMYLTKGTMPFVKEKLELLGFNGTSLAQLDLSHPKAISFVGNQVDLWCKHEKNLKGELQERWSISTGMPAVVLPPLSGKKMRELDALFGKGLKANANAVPAKTATRREVKAEDENQEEPPAREEPPLSAYNDPEQFQATDDDIGF